MTLTLPFTPESPRITLFGIDCHFTSLVLAGLLAEGQTIGGMILPGPPGARLPLAVRHAASVIPLIHDPRRSAGVVDILRERRIPAYRIGNLQSSAAIEAIRSFSTSILVCACFPYLIPRELLDLFSSRAVNVHPSLLPDKRGPDPLFWTLREGVGRSGITIHELSPRFDEGPIVAQRAITYDDATTEVELETSLASVAVTIILELIPSLIDDAPRTTQDDSGATYAPWPQAADYRLEPTMTARAAFNFVRGIQGRGVPIVVEYQGADMVVDEAIRYATNLAVLETGTIPLAFRDGYVVARLRSIHDRC